jgi:hypothetical protein
VPGNYLLWTIGKVLKLSIPDFVVICKRKWWHMPIILNYPGSRGKRIVSSRPAQAKLV